MKFPAFWTEFEELINPNRIRMKNVDRIKDIVVNLIDGGPNRLQIVSDYDRTISKQYDHHKDHISSFGIINHLPTISEDYTTKEKALVEKYHPIEIDPTIDLEIKKNSMIEWWDKSIELLRGTKFYTKDIEDIIRKKEPSLRDGTSKMFKNLFQAQIPVLVFSAGIGNTIEAILKVKNILYPNVKIVSNFLKLDNDNKIQGYQEDIIHVFNKNEYALHSHHCYDLIRNRDNIILMGDSLGDSNMADGVPKCTNILKIGFLFSKDHKKYNILLDEYMKRFDIVLVDDQTMDVPNLILKYILTNQ